MDNKQLMIIAAGIVVLAIVVIGAAFFVLNDNGGSSATPTPAPTATPGPTATGSTAQHQALATSQTPLPGGPLIISAQVDKTGTMAFVSITLNVATAPIDTSHLQMKLVCDGQTYSNFWTLKSR